MGDDDNPTEFFSKFPIVKLLKNSVFHCTNVRGLEAIVRDGHIRPNDGDFSFSFPQSKGSFAQSINAISLFDFRSMGDEGIAGAADNFLTFFCLDSITAVLTLDGTRLAKFLVPNRRPAVRKQIRFPHRRYIPTYIPEVEAWYRVPIPLDWVGEVFLIFDKGISNFEKFPSLRDCMDALPQRKIYVQKNQRDALLQRKAYLLKNPTPLTPAQEAWERTRNSKP